MAQPAEQKSDGYSDMPLNTRQQNAVSVIKAWSPVQAQHRKCIKTAIQIIKNVLYKPKQEKFQKLRLNKPKVKQAIVDVKGGIKLLKLAGFTQKSENDGQKILCIEAPSTIEELEQLTDIWLILLRTQYNLGVNPDPNAPKGAALPKQFSIPNSIQPKMKSFFESNEVTQSSEFQKLLKASNVAANALERYNHFGKAIKLLLSSSDSSFNFFDLESEHGLNDFDASDVAAMLISEILCGYFDEDESLNNLILAEDLRIMAEKQQQLNRENNIEDDILKAAASKKRVFRKSDKVLVDLSDEEVPGTIRWIGESEKWDSGEWFGVELESENLIYGHNGYFNQERFFGCPDKFGIYVRESQILRLVQSGNHDNHNDNDEEKKAEDAEQVLAAKSDVYTVLGTSVYMRCAECVCICGSVQTLGVDGATSGDC